jgi:hypothetical protein
MIIDQLVGKYYKKMVYPNQTLLFHYTDLLVFCKLKLQYLSKELPYLVDKKQK